LTNGIGFHLPPLRGPLPLYSFGDSYSAFPRKCKLRPLSSLDMLIFFLPLPLRRERAERLQLSQGKRMEIMVPSPFSGHGVESAAPALGWTTFFLPFPLTREIVFFFSPSRETSRFLSSLWQSGNFPKPLRSLWRLIARHPFSRCDFPFFPSLHRLSPLRRPIPLTLSPWKKPSLFLFSSASSPLCLFLCP